MNDRQFGHLIEVLRDIRGELRDIHHLLSRMRERDTDPITSISSVFDVQPIAMAVNQAAVAEDEETPNG